MRMLQETLMVDIHWCGDDSVVVACAILVDKKSSGNYPRCFNVVIYYFLLL